MATSDIDPSQLLQKLASDAMNNPRFLDTVLERRAEIHAAENKLRQAAMTSPSALDGHAGLVRLYHAPPQLRMRVPRVPRTMEDVDAKHVFPHTHDGRGKLGDPSVAPTFSRFMAQFEAITRGLLAELPHWPGVVLAGGAVLKALLPLDPRQKKFMMSHYLEDKFDLDLFFVGRTQMQESFLFNVSIRVSRSFAGGGNHFSYR